MAEAYAKVSVSTVLLDSDGHPIITTGQEAQITLGKKALARFRTEEQRKEFFLAMCHQGAERLWQAMRDELMAPIS